METEKTSEQGPLTNCNYPVKYTNPDSCVVYLATDYTLDDHKKTVGDALPEGAIEYSGIVETERDIAYSAKLDRDSVSRIRSNPGVKRVECELRRWPQQSVLIELTSEVVYDRTLWEE